MINEKMYSLGSTRSKIRELFEYGKTLAQKIGSENVFDYTLGNPSVPCPEEVTKTIISEVQNPMIHGYTSAQGTIGARKAICDYNFKRYGFELNPDLTYLTCGAAAGLAITLRALISSPNDKVLTFAPFFPEYKVFAENAGGSLIYSKCDESTFDIDFLELEKTICSDVQAVIINSPNNPSGTVYGEETIIKLSKFLNDKQREYGHAIYLITDEPYREILFDGAVCPFIPKYYDNTVVCYSYSKALSIPGERIGYVSVSPNAENAQKLYLAIAGAGRSLGYVCAPALFQAVIEKCVDKVSDSTVYKDNRDVLVENLTKLGFTCVNPKGAFYIFMKSPMESAEEFSDIAKTFGILVVPSDSFGVKGFVRLATCVSPDLIKRSLPAFEKLAKELKMI
ncbi:MAG: pyridoxal phosphate-dependent aminotransferase [Clostridiales bacterium]|nr:pyridoxal phosphate-dependent aminotransferase [Clostridiales bacterium]